MIKTSGTRHFIIPDTQVKPGVATDHLEAAANYIVEKQPEVIIHLGDHWDMHSLSTYDRGTKKAEGGRYSEDIECGIDAMDVFMGPLRELHAKQARSKVKRYKPRMVFLLGNHENRIARHANAHPELYGHIGFHNLELERFGWEVHDFLDPVCIDGVYYAHYFYQPLTGRAYGGVIHTRLKNLGFSFTMGHQQGLETAIRCLNNGQMHRGLIAGSFYQHEEDYKGPQANDHWRGCLMKNEVKDGNYCLMELSMKYLMEHWL